MTGGLGEGTRGAIERKHYRSNAGGREKFHTDNDLEEGKGESPCKEVVQPDPRWRGDSANFWTLMFWPQAKMLLGGRFPTRKT